MIKFSVSRLDRENIELSGSEPAEFLDLADGDVYEAVSPVEYDLLVSKVSGGILVSGSCRVVIAGECGRCLLPVEEEICASDIEVFYDPEQFGEEADISEDIRCELLLELPMRLLCSDDCCGLCPDCGCNLNESTCECAGARTGSLAWSGLDELDL